MNRLRQHLAKLIANNGGYSNNDGSWALEWNVECGFGIDEDINEYVVHSSFIDNFQHQIAGNEDQLKRAIKLANKSWKPDRVWDWVIEDLSRSLKEDDGYNMLSPPIAKHWGLPDDITFDVKWEFHGRCGKHLVLTTFEGYNLEYRNDNVVEDLTTPDDYRHHIPNRIVPSLIAFIHECDKMFDRANIRLAFYSSVAFEACRAVEAKWEQAESDLAIKRLRKAIKQAIPIIGTRGVLDACASVIETKETTSV